MEIVRENGKTIYKTGKQVKDEEPKTVVRKKKSTTDAAAPVEEVNDGQE